MHVRLRIFGVCVGLLLLLGYVQGKQIFAAPNGTVNVTCQINSGSFPDQFGYFMNGNPVTQNTTFNIYQQRVGEIPQRWTNLIIKVWDKTQQLVLDCTSFDTDEGFSLSIVEAVPPSEISIHPSLDGSVENERNITSYTYNETDSARHSLFCRAQKLYRPVGVSWNIDLKNGTKYSLPDKAAIELQSSRLASGTYTCLLQNIAGPPVPLMQSVVVTVQYIGDVRVQSPPSGSRHIAQRKMLDITCASDALPAVNTYSVYFQSTTSSAPVLLKTGIGTDGKYTLPHALQRTDSGTYTCEGTNVVGSGNGSAIVSVVVPPGPVRNLVLNETTHTDAVLSWNMPEDNGGQNISQYAISCTTNVDVELPIVQTVNADGFNELTVSVTSLFSAVPYNCSVTASNGFPGVPFGEPAYLPTAVIPLAGGKPCPPKLTILSTGNMNVCVSWIVPCTAGVPLTRCSLLRKDDPTSSPKELMHWPGSSMQCSTLIRNNTFCDVDVLTGYYIFEVVNSGGSARSKELAGHAATVTSTSTIATTDRSSTPEKSSSSSNTGVIAGVVVAVVVVVVISIVIVFFIWKGKQAESGSKAEKVRWTSSDGGGKSGKELNYANVQVTSTGTAKPTKPAGEPTTYASIDAQKTQAKARGDESGTSTVV